MTNDAVRRAVRRPAAQARGAADPAPHGPRRLDPGGDRGGRAAAGARARRARPARRTSAWPAAWRSTASPTARCCATAASRSIWIQPAAGDAGGALGAALAAYHLHAGKPRGSTRQRRRHARRLPRPELRAGRRSSGGWSAAGARFETRADEADMIERTAADAGRGQGGRLVPGPHGVRAARARRPLDPRRPALADDAEDAQPQGQVPRESSGPSRPSVLREDVGRLVRARRATAPTCCWSPTSCRRAPPRHDARRSRRSSASTSSTCRARTSRR